MKRERKENKMIINVVKKPMYLMNDSGELIDYQDKKFTVVEGTDKVLGVVSSKYEICQNRDAFSFIDYIGGNSVGFEYVKAGETQGGLVYIIAKIPNVNLMGDAITPYIIFQNSHDGMNSVKATICPLRIICQNQFNVSFRQSSNTVRIIHSSQMDARMLTAREMMRDVAGYMETFTDTATNLATKKISYDAVINVFNDVFKYKPETMSTRQLQNFEDARNDFLACYNSDDNQNFKGTAWGVMNGAADYLTHHRSVRKTHPDMIFVNTTLLATTLNQIFNRISV
jgi:phage/plasmid-like protein (TIGR03299 family)